MSLLAQWGVLLNDEAAANKSKRTSREYQLELDGASALPWLGSVMHDVRGMMQANSYLALILVDLKSLADIEAECGRNVYNEVIGTICKEVLHLRHKLVRAQDLICSVQPFGEEIVLFLGAPRRTEQLTSTVLEATADRIWGSLAPKVAELVRPYGGRGRFHLGYSLALPNEMIQTERLIYRAIDQARAMAEDYGRRIDARSRERLRDLIIRRQLTPVYQPIVQLPSFEVRAYEALIRGPPGTDLASPAMLFNLAGRVNLVAELDRACCECAISKAVALPEGTLLFANVLPALINDPSFRAGIIEGSSTHLDPSRIVLEVNEGVAIRSYEVLTRGIAELRANGIRVAVDDLGAGHTNLDQVLRLRPDFLKLDISLIRGIDKNPMKQALIESVVSMGRAVGATVIAEGIEESEERDTVMSLGVPWAQGFLFARPAATFVKPREQRAESGRPA
jgi:EAL domain-containing protein (putative c-di-GMP-specific phosphodiesterase class I)